MDEAAAAVAEGVRTVVRNPVIVGVAALVTLALAPLVAVVGAVGVVLSVVLVGPLLVRFVTGVLVKPLLFGGLAGVADAGIDGEAALEDYTDALRGTLASLVGASLAYEGAVLAVTVAAGLAVAAVLAAGSVMPAAGGRPADLVAVGVGGVGALALAALAVAFQFVDVAVVVGGADARGALRESLSLTRATPLGVLWYTALRLALFGAVLLPGVVVGLAGPVADLPLGALGWIVTGLLVPVALAAVVSAHVAYYRRRTRG